MKEQFNILKTSRKIISKKIENLTLEQLHEVPDGFNNSIVWNVAHVVVTQQLLHYKLSGLDCLAPEELIDTCKKGTKPTAEFSQEEFDEIKDLLIGLPETLEEDYNEGLFKDFQEYPTSTGYTLISIEDAITFNNFHEGIHIGVIFALLKLV